MCISAIMDTRSHSSQVPGDAAAAAGMARLIWWVVAPSRACHHPAHVMSHMMGTADMDKVEITLSFTNIFSHLVIDNAMTNVLFLTILSPSLHHS